MKKKLHLFILFCGVVVVLFEIITFWRYINTNPPSDFYNRSFEQEQPHPNHRMANHANTHTEGYLVVYHYSFNPGCPADKPIGFWQYACVVDNVGDCTFSHYWDYQCEFDCHTLDALLIEKGKEKDFEACSNREIVKTEWGCYRSQLKECPVGFVRRRNGGCASLLAHWAIDTTEEVCAQLTDHYWDNDRCIRGKAEGERVLHISEKSCKKYPDRFWDKEGCVQLGRGVSTTTDCPKGFMMDIEKKYCISCKERGVKLTTTKAECSACMMTGNYTWDQTERKCVPIISPKEDLMSPVYDEDTEALIDLDLEHEALISQEHVYRPTKKSYNTTGEKHAYYGYQKCNTEKDVHTTKTNCESCYDREYTNGKCILKK